MRISLNSRLIALGAALAAVVLVLDLMAGAYVAVSVGYVALVLVSLGSSSPSLAFYFAALATVLTVVAGLVTLPDHASADLINRGLALVVVWSTAVLCRRHIRTARDAEETDAKLQEQRDRATTTAHRAEQALRSERSDRARIEEELEEAEQRYRAVFNQTYQFVAVLDRDGRVDEVNDTLRGLGLMRAADQFDSPIWEFPLWGEQEGARLRAAVAAASAGDFVRDEFSLWPPSGAAVIVDLSLKPIRNPEGAVDLIILEARDITQHKRDQAQLIQAQKMEVLGQFASGIAHDFNNLLTVISGNLELAERRVRDDEATASRIAKAVNAVFQGRSLTDRILAFARKKQLEPRSTDVRALVTEAIGLSQSGLDENTAIESDVAPDLWPCWADPGQLQTALFNLLINARDAMPNGGEIRVRALNTTLREETPRNWPDLADGDYVVISVHDGGDGIPADILDKVTDPFFTTKDLGGGSGLGLSMVAEFIQESDGDLTIESAEGLGTTVSLYLPRSLQPAEDDGRRGRAPTARCEGRVLVVEDDPEVRDVAVSMLTDLGYWAMPASGSEDALALLRGDEDFDLLLTDVMMPGDKDGRELGRLARTLLPGLAVLYSSADSQFAKEIRESGQTLEDFISKPYHYGELAQKVEGLLSRHGEVRS